LIATLPRYGIYQTNAWQSEIIDIDHQKVFDQGGAQAHLLEKKWLEGSTGLKNDPQDRQVFPLAGTLLGKFLATLLYSMILTIFLILSKCLK
jgi:hypothetical protein